MVSDYLIRILSGHTICPSCSLTYSSHDYLAASASMAGLIILMRVSGKLWIEARSPFTNLSTQVGNPQPSSISRSRFQVDWLSQLALLSFLPALVKELIKYRYSRDNYAWVAADSVSISIVAALACLGSFALCKHLFPSPASKQLQTTATSLYLFVCPRFATVKHAYGRRIIIKLTGTGKTSPNPTAYFVLFATSRGDIYLGCRRQHLFLTHLLLLIGRLPHGLLKWLSIPLQILWDIKNGEFCARIFPRIADIVVIPVLTLTMEMVYLVGVLLASYDPNILYRTREIAGKLELLMYRADHRCDHNAGDLLPILARCFIPIINLDYLDYVKDQQETLIDICKIHWDQCITQTDQCRCERKITLDDDYFSPAMAPTNLKKIFKDPPQQLRLRCRSDQPRAQASSDRRTLEKIRQAHPTWSSYQIARSLKISKLAYDNIMHKPSKAQKI